MSTALLLFVEEGFYLATTRLMPIHAGSGERQGLTADERWSPFARRNLERRALEPAAVQRREDQLIFQGAEQK